MRADQHLVQLLLPLYDNEGHDFPRAQFDRVAKELTERFGWWHEYRTELERRFAQDRIVVRAQSVTLL